MIHRIYSKNNNISQLTKSQLQKVKDKLQYLLIMIKVSMRIFILSGMIMITNIALADITTISNFIPLQELLQKTNGDTLVIFDVDHVLIMPTDEYTLNRHGSLNILLNYATNCRSI